MRNMKSKRRRGLAILFILLMIPTTFWLVGFANSTGQKGQNFPSLVGRDAMLNNSKAVIWGIPQTSKLTLGRNSSASVEISFTYFEGRFRDHQPVTLKFNPHASGLVVKVTSPNGNWTLNGLESWDSKALVIFPNTTVSVSLNIHIPLAFPTGVRLFTPLFAVQPQVLVLTYADPLEVTVI